MKMLLTALVFVSASAFAEEHKAAAPAADHGKPAAAATVDCKDKKNADMKECKEHHAAKEATKDKKTH